METVDEIVSRYFAQIEDQYGNIHNKKGKKLGDPQPKGVEALSIASCAPGFAVFAALRNFSNYHHWTERASNAKSLVRIGEGGKAVRGIATGFGAPEKLAKVVEIGLHAVFELIRETLDTHPSLCVRALTALLDILQALEPETLRSEAKEVIDSLYRLLMGISQHQESSQVDRSSGEHQGASASTTEAPMRASWRRLDSAAPSSGQGVSSISCACLLSLVVAKGQTAGLLAALSQTLRSVHSLASDQIKLPEIVISLQRSVHAVLSGSVVQPSWYSQGLRKDACTQSFPIDRLPKEEGESRATMISDGQFIYLHTSSGLHKIGSGYKGTVKGHVYLTNSKFASHKNVWLGYARGQLFLRSSETGSSLRSFDSETLELDRTFTLEGDIPKDCALLSDGDHIAYLGQREQGGSGLCVRLFSPVCSPMPLMQEVPLDLTIHSVQATGKAKYDAEGQGDLHEIVAKDEIPGEVAQISAGHEYCLLLTKQGKVFWRGNGATLGFKTPSSKERTPVDSDDGVDDDVEFEETGGDGDVIGGSQKGSKVDKPSASQTLGSWRLLHLPLSPPVVHISSGHEGSHAVLLTEDGLAFFVGTPRRGNDGWVGPGAAGDGPNKGEWDRGGDPQQRHVEALGGPVRPKLFGQGPGRQLAGRVIVSSACNQGSTALITREGRLVILGKDEMHVPPERSIIHQHHVVQVSLGKAHGACVTRTGYLLVFGVNNRCQCGLPPTVLGASTSQGPGEEGEEEEEADEMDGDAAKQAYCAKGWHKFHFDMCRICTYCGECTGYQARCVCRWQGARRPGDPCGCGAGNAGCRTCGVCKSCGSKALGQGLVRKGAIRRRQRDGESDVAADGDWTGPKLSSQLGIQAQKLNLDGHRIQQVACGLYHTVALTKTGIVYTFGSNSHGQLGRGPWSAKELPGRLPVSETVVQVAAGSFSTVCLTECGRVLAYGSGTPQGPIVDIGGPEARLRATWVGASGGQVFVKMEENLLRAEELLTDGCEAMTQLVAGRDCLAILGRSGNLVMDRMTGKSRKYPMDGDNPQVLIDPHQCCVTLDPLFNVIWVFSFDKSPRLSTYHPGKPGWRAVPTLTDSLCSITGSELAIPIKPGSLVIRSHVALFLLGCMDTLIAAHNHRLDVKDSVSDGRTESRDISMVPENFSLVKRFGETKEIYWHNDEEAESISFSVNLPVWFGGVSLYTGSTTSRARCRLFQLRDKIEVLLTATEMQNIRGTSPQHAFMFPQLTKLEPDVQYTIRVRVNGISDRCGGSGKPKIVTQDGITFSFKNDARCTTTARTDVVHGQIPGLYYRPITAAGRPGPTGAGSQVLFMPSCSPFDSSSRVRVLSEEFTSDVTPECLDSLMNLLNWAWTTFTYILSEVGDLSGPSLLATVCDLQRYAYVATACLRILRHYLLILYPLKANPCTTETTRFAEIVGDIRILVKNILQDSKVLSYLQSICTQQSSKKAPRKKKLREDDEVDVEESEHPCCRLYRAVLAECHRCMTDCFYIFHPTEQLKWEHLCQVLHAYLSDHPMDVGAGAQTELTLQDRSRRVLSSVLSSLLTSPFSLLDLVPPGSPSTSTSPTRPRKVEQGKTKFTGAGRIMTTKYPLLASHMHFRVGVEGNGYQVETAREVIDTLLSILARPVRLSLDGVSATNNQFTSSESLEEQASKLLLMFMRDLVVVMMEDSRVTSGSQSQSHPLFGKFSTCPSQNTLTASMMGADMLGPQPQMAAAVGIGKGSVQAASGGVLTTRARFPTVTKTEHNCACECTDTLCFSVERPGVCLLGCKVYTTPEDTDCTLVVYENAERGPFEKWKKFKITSKWHKQDKDVITGRMILSQPIRLKPYHRYALQVTLKKKEATLSTIGKTSPDQLRGPDGTLFSLWDCTLRSKFRSQAEGHIPCLIYTVNETPWLHPPTDERYVRQRSCKRWLMQIAGEVRRMGGDLLRRLATHEDTAIKAKVENSVFFREFLPACLSVFGPLAMCDIKLCLFSLSLSREMIPAVVQNLPPCSSPDPGSDEVKTASEVEGQGVEAGRASEHLIVVESEHPYKPACYNQYRVRFPRSVNWMRLEFDPRCGTTQKEDRVTVAIPRSKREEEGGPEVRRSQGGDPDCLEDHLVVLHQMHSTEEMWPRSALILPGNEVLFIMETASLYEKDEKPNTFGFSCVVTGYEPQKEKVLISLERELSHLGGVCVWYLLSCQLMNSLELDSAGVQETWRVYQSILNRGFSMARMPTVVEALEGSLPGPMDSVQTGFLRDFVLSNPSPESAGGRLARWLQPNPFVDPGQSQVIVVSNSQPTAGSNAARAIGTSENTLVCGVPSTIWLQLRDQLGRAVISKQARIVAQAIPETGGLQAGNASVQQKKSHRIALDSRTFGGLPPPDTSIRYELTQRDKKEVYHAITMMKHYEHYSFEELRLATPTMRRCSETLMVRLEENESRYAVIWTPCIAGHYRLRVTVDDCPISESLTAGTPCTPGSTSSAGSFLPGGPVINVIPSPPGQSTCHSGSTGHSSQMTFNATPGPTNAPPTFTSTGSNFPSTSAGTSAAASSAPQGDSVRMGNASAAASGLARLPGVGDHDRVLVYEGRQSSGIRIRSQPSLQSPSLGMITPGGIVEILEELHNEDGVWVRLSQESLVFWLQQPAPLLSQEIALGAASAGGSLQSAEGWCLKDNHHIGKTLLTELHHGVQETSNGGMGVDGPDLPGEAAGAETEHVAQESESQSPLVNGASSGTINHVESSPTPTVYEVVSCAEAGHVVRALPSLAATMIGRLSRGQHVTAAAGAPALTVEGRWIRIEPPTEGILLSDNDAVAWVLVECSSGVTYLQPPKVKPRSRTSSTASGGSHRAGGPSPGPTSPSQLLDSSADDSDNSSILGGIHKSSPAPSIGSDGEIRITTRNQRTDSTGSSPRPSRREKKNVVSPRSSPRTSRRHTRSNEIVSPLGSSPGSPTSKLATQTPCSIDGQTGDAGKTTKQHAQPQSKVIDAMTPTLSTAQRSVFVCLLWHRGIVQEAMAAATCLKSSGGLQPPARATMNSAAAVQAAVAAVRKHKTKDPVTANKNLLRRSVSHSDPPASGRGARPTTAELLAPLMEPSPAEEESGEDWQEFLEGPGSLQLLTKVWDSLAAILDRSCQQWMQSRMRDSVGPSGDEKGTTGRERKRKRGSVVEAKHKEKETTGQKLDIGLISGSADATAFYRLVLQNACFLLEVEPRLPTGHAMTAQTLPTQGQATSSAVPTPGTTGMSNSLWSQSSSSLSSLTSSAFLQLLAPPQPQVQQPLTTENTPDEASGVQEPALPGDCYAIEPCQFLARAGAMALDSWFPSEPIPPEWAAGQTGRSISSSGQPRGWLSSSSDAEEILGGGTSSVLLRQRSSQPGSTASGFALQRSLSELVTTSPTSAAGGLCIGSLAGSNTDVAALQRLLLDVMTMLSAESEGTTTGDEEEAEQMMETSSVACKELDFCVLCTNAAELSAGMRAAVRQVAVKRHALQALSWLLRSVTQPESLHTLLWCYLNAQSSASVLVPGAADPSSYDSEYSLQDPQVTEQTAQRGHHTQTVLDHPITGVELAGNVATRPLADSLLVVLRSLADLMPQLPTDSPVLQLAVRAWALPFRSADQVFLHKSQVFNRLSLLLRQEETSTKPSRSALGPVHNGDVDEVSCEVPTPLDEEAMQLIQLVDVTSKADIEVNCREGLKPSLTDDSTETFWEGEADDGESKPQISVELKKEEEEDKDKDGLRWCLACFHINNIKDWNQVMTAVHVRTKGLDKVDKIQISANFSGWLAIRINNPSHKYVFRFKMKDENIRIRGMRLFAVPVPAPPSVDRPALATELYHAACHEEALKVFRLLTAQVFGRLFTTSRDEEGLNAEKKLPATSGVGEEGTGAPSADMQEHMLGILFRASVGEGGQAASRLSHLQRQVCAHVVRQIRAETARFKVTWLERHRPITLPKCLEAETNEDLIGQIAGGSSNEGQKKLASVLHAGSAGDSETTISDTYCFELLSQVLALSGSSIGKNFLCQQHHLITDIFTLLHTGTPRIQRQIVTLIPRILSELSPEILATILPQELPTLPTPCSPVLVRLLATVAKAMDIQVKVRPHGAAVQERRSVTMKMAVEKRTDTSEDDNDWWLLGDKNIGMANSIVKLLTYIIEGNISPAWCAAGRQTVCELILGFTRMDPQERHLNALSHDPRLYLAMAALCFASSSVIEAINAALPNRSPSDHEDDGHPMCSNHDDGVTVASVMCNECGEIPLCMECDRCLHLPRRCRQHNRRMLQERAVTVEVHEGCARVRLDWCTALSDAASLKALIDIREVFDPASLSGDPDSKQDDGAIPSPGRVQPGPMDPIGGQCQFCGQPSSGLGSGNWTSCGSEECQGIANVACTETLRCGHPCCGVSGEKECLPCLHGCMTVAEASAVNLKQDGEDVCMICFTDSLNEAPVIQLISCGHLLHYHCIARQLKARWPGMRITFGFTGCAICKTRMDHPILQDLLAPIQELEADVRRKSLLRLQYENLTNSGEVTQPGSRFYQDPEAYAMHRYAYYVCFKCNKAYYGGEARCDAEEAARGSSFDPSELVCGGCSDVARGQICPKHSTDFLEYKCRYCCSVAVFFCFGTTHFCDKCHDRLDLVMDKRSELPHCPAGPVGVQLDGNECPLHVEHPETGEEFALGCGICRNTHSF